MTLLLCYLELLVGQPRTAADWRHRWARRHELPCVMEVHDLPSQGYCEWQRGLWWNRAERLQAGKMLWEHTPDAAHYERAIRQARYHYRTWALAYQIRQGWYSGGWAGKWADSWEKRLMLAELYRLAEKP